MAKVASQYRLTTKELAQLLIKECDLHEGLWSLSVEFAFSGINAGPDENNIMPSAIIGVQSVGLARADAEGPLVFDAAALNPKT